MASPLPDLTSPERISAYRPSQPRRDGLAVTFADARLLGQRHSRKRGRRAIARSTTAGPCRDRMPNSFSINKTPCVRPCPGPHFGMARCGVRGGFLPRVDVASEIRDIAAAPDERTSLISRLLPFVVHRRLEPGDRLPSERELAERFAVGRGAVRERWQCWRPCAWWSGGRTPASISARCKCRAPSRPSCCRLNSASRSPSPRYAKSWSFGASWRYRPCALPPSVAASRTCSASTSSWPTPRAPSRRATTCRTTTRHSTSRSWVNAFYLMSHNRRRHYFADGTRAPLSHAQHEALREAVAARDADRAEMAMDNHLRGVESYWLHLLEQRAAATEPIESGREQE